MMRLVFEGEAHGRMHEVCRSSGLSPGLLKTLLELSPDSPRAMRDLADRWSCDASYVTALVDGLEERGLAERRQHPIDRRVKTVVLTDKGVEARAETLARLGEPPSALSTLTDDEQEQLRELLRKVADADPRLAAEQLHAS
jgi:DNA-binding MarR family transcriptional regulator